MVLIDDGCIALKDPRPEAARDAVMSMATRGAQAILLLAADGNACQPAAFDAWLQAVPVPIFGGAFPQLIFDASNQTQGYLVLGLRDPVSVAVIAGLSDEHVDYAQNIEHALPDPNAIRSMLVLVDGLAKGIGGFLDAVYDVLGGDITYFGGGAGSLTFVHRPCLFSNRGMLMDHALLVGMTQPCVVGVEHGWEKFAGPFAVTAAERNRVTGLDYQSAVTTYREHVERDSGNRFAEQDFFSIAKAYPLGMEKPDGGMIVRDPITSDGDALVCVGEVPVNSVAYILKGVPERLIAAAEASARQLPVGRSTAFLVDCISRVLFLQNDFPREVAAVMHALGERPLVGVLSLGEIANGGDYCLEFYNKTLVLAAAT